MSRNVRSMQHTFHSRIESDLVLTRMSEQAVRNIESMIRGLLFPGSGYDAVIIEGLVASSGGGMVVNLTAPGVAVQMIDGGDVRYVIDFNGGSNYAVTLANGSAVGPRIDIIEAQVARINAYTDTTVYQVNPSNKSLTQGTASRDKHTYLNIRKKDGVVNAGVAPAVTAGTAGILTSTVVINPSIDLSVRYMLSIAAGTDAEFLEIDCRGASPASTTLAEVIAAINAAGFGTIADNDGSNHLRLTGPGTGENSLIRIKAPTTSSLDAYGILLGGTMGDNYCDSFVGENKWFKISEVAVAQNAVSIINANIKTYLVASTWTTDANSVDVGYQLESSVAPGTVSAFIPGYFTNGSNAGYTDMSANIKLSSKDRLCDGSLCQDSRSPIFNGAGRYLPNITDSRFLMGHTTPGSIGGSNDLLAHTHAFTQPSAHGITQPTFTYPNHQHRVAETAGAGPYFFEMYLSDGSVQDVMSSSGASSPGSGGMVDEGGGVFYSKTDGGGSCTRTTDVALTNNHSGGAVGAVSESRVNANLPLYLTCKYLMRIK